MVPTSHFGSTSKASDPHTTGGVPNAFGNAILAVEVNPHGDLHVVNAAPVNVLKKTYTSFPDAMTLVTTILVAADVSDVHH